jgi:D-amino-acid dehydrogenase
MHVAVVGAGIVGTMAAHALLDAGRRVTLVDPADQPGRPCDGNAGWIAHMDIMPLASPKVWRNLPRWMADPLGPLSIRPAYLPAIAPWLARFVAASRPGRIEASIAAIRALQAQALPAWRRRLTALDLAHHLRERGALTVWSSEAAFKAAGPMIARQREFGIPVDLLDRAALSTLEPALGPRAVAGAHYPTGCHVSDPKAVVADLAAKAQERGATFVRNRAGALASGGERVLVRCEDGMSVEADRVVVAAGAWSKPLAASLGDRIPLDTERGYNATLAPGTLGLSRPVAFEGEGFVTTPLDIGDRVGGSVEFGGLHAPADHRRTDAILARLRPFLPDLPHDADTSRRWMGFRPSIPDSLPVIGPSPRDGRVLYAFGHGHYGLTQSAVTAEIVAALVAGTAPVIDPAPYAATRFAGTPNCSG